MAWQDAAWLGGAGYPEAWIMARRGRARQGEARRGRLPRGMVQGLKKGGQHGFHNMRLLRALPRRTRRPSAKMPGDRAQGLAGGLR